MPYERLLREGKIYSHRTSKAEIRDLLDIAKRDLKDASIKALSPDRRFATAYNAALQAASAISQTMIEQAGLPRKKPESHFRICANSKIAQPYSHALTHWSKSGKSMCRAGRATSNPG